jgi:AbrB family looped-hinge helix DNA binding protein
MPAVIINLRKNGQLTLPAGLRKALKLEVGDLLDVCVGDGKIILTPVKR